MFSPVIRVYGSRETDFSKNGYAMLTPISGTLTHELNGRLDINAEFAASEQTEYLKRNALVKIPVRYHGEFRQQIFRIYKPVKDMDESGRQVVTIDARALFYDLSARLLEDCRPTQLSGNAALGYIYNRVKGGRVPTDVQFAFSSDIAKYSTAYYENKSLTQALIGADNSFVNRWGGHLYRDNNYFSINKEMEGSRSSGVICYGDNLTKITYTEDTSDCVTWLIASDNFGNRIELHDDSVPNDDFPYHIYKAVKFRYDAENKAQFKADAEAYFEEHKKPAINIKVKFADIKNDKEYADFQGLSDFEVGDRIIIYHKGLGINYGNLLIIAKTYDLATHETKSIEIGSFKGAVCRSGFMPETLAVDDALSRQLSAVQSQLDEVAFDALISTPITTADGHYLTTVDGKYLIYKE